MQVSKLFVIFWKQPGSSATSEEIPKETKWKYFSRGKNARENYNIILSKNGRMQKWAPEAFFEAYTGISAILSWFPLGKGSCNDEELL